MAGPACACTFRWIAGNKRPANVAFTEEDAQPQDCGSEDCGCIEHNYTENPYVKLAANGPKIRALRETIGQQVARLQADGRVDRTLMETIGKELQDLTGLMDDAFFRSLPPSGSSVVVLQGLCPLYELTLNDGNKTVSGAFAASVKRVLEQHGLKTVCCNLAMKCWRKGDKEGKELTGAAAGCEKARA